MVNPPQTKPKTPMDYARPAKDPVRNGKPRLGSRIPVVCGLYQLLPAAAIKYTYMKTSMKVMAVAIALSSAALLLHYLIGSMSY